MWRVALETEASDMLDKTKSRDDVTGGARDGGHICVRYKPKVGTMWRVALETEAIYVLDKTKSRI